MKSSVQLSWALCLAIFTTSYSSRILQVALQMYVSSGMQYGITFNFGWNVVALFIGAVFGPLLVWLLSLFLNRKPVVLIALAITALSAILVISASAAVQVVVAGAFAGLSSTMMLTTACLWQAENSDPHRRGQMIVLLLVAAGAGAALCSWVNYILSLTSPSVVAVRAAVGVQFIFILVAVLLVFFATDSYRWLLSHNKLDEARAALASVRDQDQSSPELLNYFSSLVQHRRQLDSRAMSSCCATSRKTNNDSSIIQLHTPRRLGLAAGLQIMVAFTGVQASGYYLMYLLFDMLSSGPFFAHGLIMAFVPSFDLLFTLMPYFLLPRLGLRKLLLIGSIGISICGTITTIIAAATTSDLTEVINRFNISSRDNPASAALFIFVLFTVFFFDLSWSTLVWLFVGEIGSSLGYHNENTAIAAITVAIRYVLELGVSFAITFGTSYGGYWLIVACLVLNLLFAAVIWAYYPETVGRTLEDIDLYFARAPKKLVCRDREAKRVWKRGHVGNSVVGGGEHGYTTGAEWRQMHGHAAEMQPQTHVGNRGIGDESRPGVVAGNEESWK